MLAFAEGDVTKLRREFKLVLESEQALELCRRLAEATCTPTPDATSITSVYFDRPGCPLALRALRSPQDCLKVRTKEYSPDRGRQGADRVVLEVKRERHGLTQKQRVWIFRAALRAALKTGAEGRLPFIAGGRLLPTLAVTYERQVFQASASWRVTVDRRIGFHRVTPALAFSERALTPERLDPPLHRDSRVVVEVKHLGDSLPRWLAGLQGQGRAGYSKFTEGMARLQAFEADGVVGG